MSFWLYDPQVFLYAKGTGPGDVLLRRCKIPVSSSSSSLVVPMKSDDFEDVSKVEKHLELIDDQFDWDETDYKRLVKYIHERHLLVNRQGLVIAEIYKLNDPNRVPIYIRSLDVLPLKPYIPNIMERLIPSRTVKYLEDLNGKAAAMKEENGSNITKLTARVADLEAENKKLTADMVTQKTALTALQEEVKNMNANSSKEAWMNDPTNNSEWVGVEELTAFGPYANITIVDPPGTFTVDDSSTNVQARYYYKIMLSATSTTEYKAVCLEDLTPNKERARFSKGIWWSAESKGKTYVALYTAVIQKEAWINDLTNSEWVGIEGLTSQGSWNIIIVGQPGTFTVDDSSTNVRARYWYKIKFRTNTEYKAVCLEDLTPNNVRARFLQGIWSSCKSSDGKTYVYRWF